MQDIIDDEFKARTVLSVMHRLTHVERYDRVALFESGQIVELGSPTELMATRGTRFAEVYRSHLA
jgi:ATP-binding cassette, subfamily C (CFTR/MRP), member 1